MPSVVHCNVFNFNYFTDVHYPISWNNNKITNLHFNVKVRLSFSITVALPEDGHSTSTETRSECDE